MVAVVAVLALVGAAVRVVVVDGDDGAGESAGGVTEEGGDVAPDSEEEEVVDFDAAIDELTAFVEAERGLEFLEPVDIALLDADAFEDRILLELEEDLEEEDLDLDRQWLQAFDILESGDDLEAIYRQLFAGTSLGFYDLETKELVVRGGAITPYVRQTIVHELTHALEDQHFGIFREEIRMAEDERSFGFLAFTEGTAEYVAQAYERTLGSDEQRELAEDELAFGADLDISGIPLFLLFSLVAPYEYGPELVRAVVAAGGLERLDDSFEAPPVTSEQVLEPTAYLEGEGAVDVPPPPVGAEVLDDGPLGAVFFQTLFSVGFVEPAIVARAVEGWGGDASVLYRDGEQACVRAFVVGDTPSDTDELADGLERWAESHPDASVELDNSRVDLTVCG